MLSTWAGQPYTIQDANVQAWATAVRATGATIPRPVAKAMDAMVVGLKADGVWTLITDMSILGGPDTLAGAQVPLKTSVGGLTSLNSAGFVQSDYIPLGPDMGINDYDNTRYWVGGSSGTFTLKQLDIGAPTLSTLSAYGVWGTARSQVNLFLVGGTGFPRLTAASETQCGVSLYSFGGTDFTNGTGRVAGCDIIGVRTSASAGALYYNGVQVGTVAGASATTPTVGTSALLSNNAGEAGAKRHTAYFIAPGASGAQALSIRARINTCLAGLGYGNGITTHLAIGDSITAGSAGPVTPYLTYLTGKSGFNGGRAVNVGRGGCVMTGVNGIINQYSKIAQPFRPDATFSPRGIAYVMQGTNDIANSGRTSAQVLTDLETLWSTLRADGFRVIAGTIPPRNDAAWNGTFETVRTTLNASIIADSANYDALVPWHTLLPDPNDLTYFQADKLHPNSAGEAVIAAWIAANINPVTV